MKRIIGVLLATNPNWFIIAIQIPAILFHLAKGRSWEQLSVPVKRITSFYFFNDPNGMLNFVDRTLLYSSVGLWIRTVLWAVSIFLVIVGIKLLMAARRSKEDILAN